tara:strand:- start:787 stop:1110 length:324 start_codon:yes stop_codon:yes gene_type:complete
MVSYFKEENMSKTENTKRIMPSSQRWTATPSPQEALEEVLSFVERELQSNKELRKIYIKKDYDLELTLSEVSGRLSTLRDLKTRLQNEIKAVDHIEHIEDMAWDGAL